MRKSAPKNGIVAFILLALLITVIASSVFIASPNGLEIFVPGNRAAVVDGTDVSVGFYNYFYESVVSPQELAVYKRRYKNFDPSVDFSLQIYDEDRGETWEEFFQRSAAERVTKVIFYSNQAKRKGLELFDEQREKIEKHMKDIEAEASKNEVSAGDYISIVYGRRAGKKTLKEILERGFLAQNYYEYFNATAEIADEELNGRLKEQSEDLQEVSVALYERSFASEPNKKESLKKTAREIIAETSDVESFDEAIGKFASESDRFLFGKSVSDKKKIRLGEARAAYSPKTLDWLFAEARRAGDKTVVVDERSRAVLAVYITEAPEINRKISCAARELFIPFDKENKDSKEAELLNEGIVAYLKKAENPEYALSVFCDIYRNENAENQTGGLVLESGRSGSKADDWLFDEKRRKNDFTSFKGEKGYYIILFVEKAENWKLHLKYDAISERFSEECKSTSLNKKYAFKFCGGGTMDRLSRSVADADN